MSRLTSNRQPKYTHESNFVTETLLDIYDVEELPNNTLPLKFTTIDHYKLDDTGIKVKLKSAKY